MNNLLHIPIGENFPNVINSIVEIPKDTNAKYEYDEKYDESRINFNVKIPQNLVSTYDLNDEQVASYKPYQMKGFCDALNATSDTIEEKCNRLDATNCANTACCVLYGAYFLARFNRSSRVIVK